MLKERVCFSLHGEKIAIILVLSTYRTLRWCPRLILSGFVSFVAAVVPWSMSSIESHEDLCIREHPLPTSIAACKRQRRKHWPRNSHSTMSCQSSVTRKPCSSWRKANWSPRSTTAMNRMPRSVIQYSPRWRIADFVVPAVFLRETSSCYCLTAMTMIQEEFLEEHE